MRATIALNADEMKFANYIGMRRNRRDFEQGLRPPKIGPGQEGGEPDYDHFRELNQKGFAAEMAVAKHLNLYPDLTTDPRSGSHDLKTHKGTRIDVKWTAGDNNRLLCSLKKKPGETDVLVLVVGEPPILTIVGWAYEKEIMQPQNIMNLGWRDTYALDQKVLRSIDTLA